LTGVPDLRADPDALHVLKRALPVAAAFAAGDGICPTLEGPVRYRRGDAVLTGTHGERWPVARELFLAAYDPVPPTRPGEDGDYIKRKLPVLALRLERAVQVPVGWQDDPLEGRPGDWLLRYHDGTHGVLRDAIFRDSYEPDSGETRWPPP